MNQPSKAPRAKTATAKTKKKSRVELDIEARERKRDNKRRGHKPGSRANPDADKNQTGNAAKKADPRIGSKKAVPLVVETVLNNAPKAKTPKPKKEAKPVLTPEEELTKLENDERLDSLLDMLDDGKTLSADDQSYVDQTLDRIDVLMEMLGIELGDEDDEDEEAGENMYRLLKGKD